jgi:hypothetical protein
MASKQKLGNTRGVSQWRKLETIGDAKRLLAWLIHSVRDGTLDPKVAAIMGNLANILLGAIRDDDLQTRLEKLEALLANLQTQNQQS